MQPQVERRVLTQAFPLCIIVRTSERCGSERLPESIPDITHVANYRRVAKLTASTTTPPQAESRACKKEAASFSEAELVLQAMGRCAVSKLPRHCKVGSG